MWKQRCALLHAQNTGTMESYHRAQASTLYKELQAHPTRLDFCHRSLLRRRPDFFTNGNFLAVQMWHRKVTSALTYRSNKSTSLGRDIRNWIVRRPHDPGRRARGARIPNRRRLFRLRRK